MDKDILFRVVVKKSRDNVPLNIAPKSPNNLTYSIRKVILPHGEIAVFFSG